jgi:PAS domain S-box-containing protein
LSSILFLGLAAMPVIYHQVAQTIANDNQHQAGRLKELFEYRLASTAESVSTLAGNSFVVNAFVDSPGREIYLLPLLRDYRPPLNGKSRVVVLDMNLVPIALSDYGEVFAASSLEAAKRALDSGKAQLGIAADNRSLLFAAPVYYPPASTNVGVVLLEVPTAELFAAADNLVSQQRCYQLIAADQTFYRSPCDQDASERPIDQRVTLKSSIAGQPIVLQFENNANSLFATFSGILAIYAVLALAAALLAWFVARRQVRRLTQPLIDLSNTARQIAADPASTNTAPVKGSDEVAQLATSFNQMLSEWRRLKEGLEERVQTQTKALSEKEELFRELALMSSDWFWEQDADCRFIQMSENFVPKTGISHDATLGKTRWELPVVGVSEAAWAEHRRLLEQHQPFSEFVYQMRNADGQLRWLSVSGKPLFRADGSFRGYLGTGHDITERKLAEQSLSRESHRNQVFLRTASDGIHILDTNKNVVEVSDSFCTMLGYSREELLGMNLRQWSPQLPERIMADLPRLLNDNGTAIVDTHYLCKDGRILDVEVSISAVEIDNVLVFYNSARDVTARKKSEELLRTSEERLRFLLETSPIAVRISRSSDRKLLFANRSYAEYIETDPADALSVDPRLFYAKAHDYDEILAELAAGKSVYNKLIEVIIKGKSKWVFASYMSLEYQGDAAILGWFYDVTEIRRAQELAEETARTKSTFLANMSHEIRTPMNAIIGLSQLALEKQTTPQVRDYLEKISISAQSLLGILNDILDYSKIEAGRMTLDNAPFDLQDLLHKLNNLFFVRAEEKQLALSIAVADDVPPRLIGDELRLQQVLSNVLGNAIKFTEHGHVSLHITRQASTASQVELRFRISDSGIGMSPEVRDNLFQAFNQADNSITRRFGGTGLGLVISRELLHLMGSDFVVDSLPGQGSTFSFTLTLGMDSRQTTSGANAGRPAATALHTNRSQPPCDLSGSRILVAEDNAINQQVVREFLQLSGITVTLASNGEEALGQLATGDFDLVLMDVHMPVMDGLEATRKIRQQPHLAQLPILALTAGVTQGEQENALAAGMNDFVSKPVDPEALVAALCHWLKPASSGQGNLPPAPASTPADSPLQLPGFDLSNLEQMLDGDRPLIVSMLEHFRADTSGDLLAIDRAIAAGDFAEAERQAHKLKGVAGNIGAMDVYRLASALDAELKQGRCDPAVLNALHDAYRLANASIDSLSRVAVAQDGAGNAATLQALAPELDRLLAGHELVPEELLDALEAALNTPQHKQFQQLRRHIASIDYKKARASLQQLLTETGKD